MWRKQICGLWKPQMISLLYPDGEAVEEPDSLDKVIENLLNSVLPTPQELQSIISKATEIFREEPNILEIKPPIVICGDVHGQFDDMLQIFQISGTPPYTQFLFLGDYVDRGTKSIEIMILLCIFKIKYPNKFFMIRGNHESMNISQVYGFYQEVLTKYRSDSLYQSFKPLFESMPIAAVINGEYFCVHGGISENAMTLSEISNINRFTEIPSTGALCELVWNDPAKDNSGFTESGGRNVGALFGMKSTDLFFSKNNGINLIIRAHQLKKQGFEYCQNNKVLTLFSAPNYESMSGNDGAILCVDEKMTRNIIRFKKLPPNEKIWERLSSVVYNRIGE
ncbi:Ser/Thr protein phosphatase [Histomonas meleagridis]|uniref:Ser/Thr protein phosphatase n=1 Tax=Histomonas meleagridis TaxID=135588 RepID=UPI00355A3790|nr:Ser/Thr protein phosphatase [Histomonas meleagridis]KAH0797416.1 Ser/Thr protein phosphatase [Histomonas meleagridis]